MSKEKSKLVRKIREMKSYISPDELGEINKLYDKYFSPEKADLIGLHAYKDYLKGYLKAKFQNTKYQRYK